MVRAITVRYKTDEIEGEFYFETDKVDYQELLQLATQEAHDRCIKADDVYALKFEDWMI